MSSNESDSEDVPRNRYNRRNKMFYPQTKTESAEEKQTKNISLSERNVPDGNEINQNVQTIISSSEQKARSDENVWQYLKLLHEQESTELTDHVADVTVRRSIPGGSSQYMGLLYTTCDGSTLTDRDMELMERKDGWSFPTSDFIDDDTSKWIIDSLGPEKSELLIKFLNAHHLQRKCKPVPGQTNLEKFINWTHSAGAFLIYLMEMLSPPNMQGTRDITQTILRLIYEKLNLEGMEDERIIALFPRFVG